MAASRAIERIAIGDERKKDDETPTDHDQEQTHSHHIRMVGLPDLCDRKLEALVALVVGWS